MSIDSLKTVCPTLFNRRCRVYYCLRSETHHGGHQEPSKDSDPGRRPVQHSGRQHGSHDPRTTDDANSRTPG